MTTPIKPSEWIRQWCSANGGDWPGGIMAYLDEYQDSVHPIARAQPPLRVDDLTCIKCRQPAHHNGGNCPTDYSGTVVIVPAHPAPTSTPGEDEPGPLATAWCDGFGCAMNHRDEANWAELDAPRNPYHPAPTSSSDEDPEARIHKELPGRRYPHSLCVPVECHKVQTRLIEERDAAREELERVRAENARLQKAQRSALCQVNDCAEEACWFYCDDHESGRISKLKAENARLTGELDHERREAAAAAAGDAYRWAQGGVWKTALTESERLVSELRAELAKREDVVVAAESLLLALEHGRAADQESAVQRIATALDALSALDQSPQVDAGMGIVVGSTWLHKPTGKTHTITKLRSSRYGIAFGDSWDVSHDFLADNFTHVSDPPVSESEG